MPEVCTEDITLTDTIVSQVDRRSPGIGDDDEEDAELQVGRVDSGRQEVDGQVLRDTDEDTSNGIDLSISLELGGSAKARRNG